MRHCFFYLIISTVRIEMKVVWKAVGDWPNCFRGPLVHLFSKVNSISFWWMISSSLGSRASSFGKSGYTPVSKSSSLGKSMCESTSSSWSPFATRRQWGMKMFAEER